MNFKQNKKNGFSLVEVSVGISIICLILTIVFPVLKCNNRITQDIYLSSLLDKNERNILQIISEQIQCSEKFFLGPTRTDSEKIGIFTAKEILSPLNCTQAVKNSGDSGNAILIKIPTMSQSGIRNYFIIFQFYKTKLYVYEGECFGGFYHIRKKAMLIKNIHGNFKKVKKGMMIMMNFKKNNKLRSLQAYENIE